MTLDLAKLDKIKLDVAMPETHRGRTATEVPAVMLDHVKATFDMPKGKGGSYSVPNGHVNPQGKDVDVVAFVGLLRKAADKLGYGLTVKVGERGDKATPVHFKAQPKSVRVRRTKAEIEAANTGQSALPIESAETADLAPPAY